VIISASPTDKKLGSSEKLSSGRARGRASAAGRIFCASLAKTETANTETGNQRFAAPKRAPNAVRRATVLNGRRTADAAPTD